MNRDTATPVVTSFPGPAAAEWVIRHHQFAAPSTYAYEFVWDVTADASGPFVTDVDGNVLMDMVSHVAAAPLGYNNPLVMEKLAEFDLIDPLKIAGQDFYVGSPTGIDDPAVNGPTQLMERLVETTSDYGLDTVFLSNSGAEAVENAIKISYASGGHRGVTFDGAFHGRTLGTLSLNRSKAIHRRGYPEVPGIVSVPFCSCPEYSECSCGWRTNGAGGNALADLLHERTGVVSPSEVAYVIVEPQQGEGGYRPMNPEFAADLSALCAEYDIKLIADEIQSGLGRTGTFWASDHYEGFSPDIITSAKALRVGATIASAETFPAEPARLSSTWGAGDVLASMQGVATIDAIRENGLLANVTRQGRNFRERLADLNGEGVEDIRGMGLMLGVEFDTQERRDAVVEAALKRGLMTLGCGFETVRLLPPLDVTDREVELAVELFGEAVEDAA